MGKATRSVAISIPALLILAVAALMAFFAFGSATGSEFADGGRIKGVVEWVQRDATDVVLNQSLSGNTTMDLIKDDARARLGVSGTTAPTSDTDLYDNITLCGTDDSGGLCSTISDVSNITENNPQSGTGATGATGVYTVALTFTASGAVTIEELQLSKGAVVDGTPPSTANIGAFQNVSVTLANGDTLTVTWTITVS